ncbi:MAG: GNAT family N-acetyltransferase [Deltaproteobacteria bacterium]|nr:GNAT family N-acetyltransferase [Deltaproteobacteria bacterium]
MRLVENIPLNTQIIASLISDREDLHLVWPVAKWPFDHDQWREVLNPDAGNKPFLVFEGQQLIGHAALRKTEESDVYAVSFLYLLPRLRSQGLGENIIGLLEQYATEKLSVKKLILVARTYNPMALRCYTKCGFKEYSREETLIRMSKVLLPN